MIATITVTQMSTSLTTEINAVPRRPEVVGEHCEHDERDDQRRFDRGADLPEHHLDAVHLQRDVGHRRDDAGDRDQEEQAGDC